MSVPDPATGFVPPPYPHDRLTGVRDIAAAALGGLIDCSVGTPVDAFPAVAQAALDAAMSTARGYPPKARRSGGRVVISTVPLYATPRTCTTGASTGSR